MSGPSKAKKPKPKPKPHALAKPKPKATRHRVAHQVTISREATDILDEAVARFGPGTKSMLIDMSIRHAKRSRLFDGDMLTGAEPSKAHSLEQALIAGIPSILARLVDHANAKPPQVP